MMRQAMETDYYYIALSDDIRGVETAVALKNAYAFGVTLTIGINERRHGKDAKQHYNSQAAAFAQGAKEMRRLIAILGRRRGQRGRRDRRSVRNRIQRTHAADRHAVGTRTVA